uniref:uncharacterized protein LOC120339836 isoform X2 n=1 Tax=Styela clava TaxID=7725 RepID=UPI00193ABD44|nr:uncharacterized protein LOC120339836 isoform X2 [Styela clava]
MFQHTKIKRCLTLYVVKCQHLQKLNKVSQPTLRFTTVEIRVILKKLDNKTYKLILHCNLNGGKEILVETRTPSAKSEVILKVRNKLIEFGNGWEDVKVYPSQCDRVIGK